MVVSDRGRRVVGLARGWVAAGSDNSWRWAIRELSTRLGPWRRPLAIHDPGKIVLDLTVAVALGGDCAADVAVLRAQPGVFGLVASDPTVSRLIATLAEDVDAALGAIASARAVARQQVWGWAGAPVADGRVVIDLDATLVTAHSEKEFATRTWKRPSGSIRCWRMPITAMGVLGSRWPGCCVRAMRVRIPRPITLRCSTQRWRSCPSRAHA